MAYNKWRPALVKYLTFAPPPNECREEMKNVLIWLLPPPPQIHFRINDFVIRPFIMRFGSLFFFYLFLCVCVCSLPSASEMQSTLHLLNQHTASLVINDLIFHCFVLTSDWIGISYHLQIASSMWFKNRLRIETHDVLIEVVSLGRSVRMHPAEEADVIRQLWPPAFPSGVKNANWLARKRQWNASRASTQRLNQI